MVEKRGNGRKARGKGASVRDPEQRLLRCDLLLELVVVAEGIDIYEVRTERNLRDGPQILHQHDLLLELRILNLRLRWQFISFLEISFETEELSLNDLLIKDALKLLSDARVIHFE